MDLTSKHAEFCGAWCNQHLKHQPIDDKSLTWYVGAKFLYTEYRKSASREGELQLNPEEFWVVLRLVFSNIVNQRLNGVGIFSGVRYFADNHFEEHRFGV